MTRLTVAFGFLVAFVAGLLIGIGPAAKTSPASPETPEAKRGGPESWLAEQLKLTSDQQQQMKEIWSELAKRGGRHQRDDRGKLRKDRDDAIAGLIREEDRAAYDQILKDYDEKNKALDAEFKQAFQQAVARTKEILTPEQRQKYEEILARQDWEGRDRRRPSAPPSATQPRSDETTR